MMDINRLSNNQNEVLLQNSVELVKDNYNFYSNKTIKEKLDYIDEIVIGYPFMNYVLDKIDECQKYGENSNEPECMSILGPSRCGKTTIVKHHMRKYPDIEDEQGIRKTILYSLVPCPAAIGGLSTQLLHDLGDPLYNSGGRLTNQKLRFYELAKRCNVKLIILDEVQHLVDRNRNKLLKDSADYFKNMIGELKIPIIFVGITEAEKIFTENQQLNLRTTYKIPLGPFHKSDNYFRAILYHLDKALPLKYYSGLYNDDISRRIYVATNGYLGILHILIKESVNIALKMDTQVITSPILAKAYDNKVKGLFNISSFIEPFNSGFDVDEYLEKIKE